MTTRWTLTCLLPLAGCYASWQAVADAPPEDDAGPGDDAGADGSDAEAGEEGVDPSCRPQEVWEDPDIDCDMCVPCVAAPYRWVGDGCTFAPICCVCAGPDCDSLYATYESCLAAHASCPVATIPPRRRDARLAWVAPGGAVGTGPRLFIDGAGLARFWEWGTGTPDLDGTPWERTDWNYAVELGPASANEIFDRLAAIDVSGLPHPPAGWVECYPTLRFRLCDGCEPVRLDYQQARDLLPEFRAVYELLDGLLCRGIRPGDLPSAYCEF
jgi:hypothetical protein